MYRVAFTYDGAWRVVKCWKVNEHATRVVDIDRRSKVKRLRVLSPMKLSPGAIIAPRHCVDLYLFALGHAPH